MGINIKVGGSNIMMVRSCKVSANSLNNIRTVINAYLSRGSTCIVRSGSTGTYHMSVCNTVFIGNNRYFTVSIFFYTVGIPVVNLCLVTHIPQNSFGSNIGDLNGFTGYVAVSCNYNRIIIYITVFCGRSKGYVISGCFFNKSICFICHVIGTHIPLIGLNTNNIVNSCGKYNLFTASFHCGKRSSNCYSTYSGSVYNAGGIRIGSGNCFGCSKSNIKAESTVTVFKNLRILFIRNGNSSGYVIRKTESGFNLINVSLNCCGKSFFVGNLGRVVCKRSAGYCIFIFIAGIAVCIRFFLGMEKCDILKVKSSTGSRSTAKVETQCVYKVIACFSRNGVT